MKVRALYMIMVAVLTLAVCCVCAPEGKDAQAEKTVTAEGFSPCKANAESSARHAALADALRRAVENAYGVLVEADTETKCFVTDSDTVRTTTEGFVKSYRIVEEGASGGMYRVKIEAIVVRGNSDRSLASICKRLREKLDPTFVISSNDDLTRKLLKSELSLLGLRAVDSPKAAKTRTRISIRGEAEPGPPSEVLEGSQVHSWPASADLEVSDSSGVSLPSIGVSLPSPVVEASQAQAKREAARSVVRLWVRRNLPIIGSALLSPDAGPSAPEDADDHGDGGKGSVGVWEYGSVGGQRPDPSGGERVEVDSAAVRSLAAKVASAVKAKSELGPAPVTAAVMQFRTIGPLDASVAQDLLDDLSTALTRTGAFELVERDQLEKVLKELRIQNSGLVEGETARKLGKLAGARLLVVGSISDRKDCLMITARLIDTETGRVCAAEQVRTEKDPEPLVLQAGPH